MSGNESYNMFFPSDGRERLTQKYPELGRMAEFRNLPKHHQEFVWLHACALSPLAKFADPHERARKSFEIAFRNVDYNGIEHQNFCSLIFPDNIKVAVERMAKFRPDLRSRALAALENAYETCLEVLNAPLPGRICQGEGENAEYVDVTPAMIKQVIEAKQKAREELPDIIRQLEEGFGITIATKDGSNESTIMQFIRNKQLNHNN